LLAVTTWPDVGFAFVTLLPGLFAAFYAYRASVASRDNRESLRTPSGTTVGKQVENTHHTSLANNYRLQALGDGLAVPMPEKAAQEEARIEDLNGEPGAKP
jgi:hypothetical protein